MSRFSVGIFLTLAICATVAGLWWVSAKPIEKPKPVLGVTSVSNETKSTSLPNAQKLYGLINGYRREHKLTPLTVHTALEQSAELKLQDMLAKKYWRHGDTNNYPPWSFFSQAGYQYEKAGENLAFGVKSNWQTFSNWQESPTHDAQLLEPEYNHMGIATECDYYQEYAGQTCLVVLHLGKPQ